MIKYFFQGLLLGLAYVAPIGMQNMYVINAALSLEHSKAYKVAFITIFFDITLALSCFLGIGLIFTEIPVLKNIFILVGSLMVLYIGYTLIMSKPSLNNPISMKKTFFQIAVMCFTVTWLNPQAIIDGSLILGGFRASLPANVAAVFIAGVATASLTWFLSLTTIVSQFHRIINNNLLRTVNIICGSVIIFFGLKLGFSFIGMF